MNVNNFSQGFTPLAGCTVEGIDDESSFNITSENFSLNLKADSSELRTMWVEAISKEIRMSHFFTNSYFFRKIVRSQ
jgi:hypothetical protein